MTRKTTTSSNAKRPRRKTTATGSAAVRALLDQYPVSDFLSYRKFLTTLYEARKADAGSYSYMQFAQDMGLSRSNVLWLVTSGRRKLTKNTLDKIVKALRISGVQRQYIERLVEYNNAIRPDKREQAFQNLLALKTKDLEDDSQQDTLEYFAQWYHPIIRELIGLGDFQEDPEWIQSKLLVKVAPKQIKASLQLLEKLGLVERQPDGKLAQTGGQVRPDRKVSNMAAVRYHQKICEIAKESVTRVPAERRDFNAMTLNLTEKAAMMLSEKLYKVCEEVMAFEEDVEGADQVFQVNIQLFPFTKK